MTKKVSKVMKLMFLVFAWTLIFYIKPSFAQPGLEILKAKVDFSASLHTWDGFGVNYVETSQTPDYNTYPQDYGGFSILSDHEKEEILDKVFGEDGLKVNIVKMFLDPFHQKSPGGPYDHTTTTENMRYFVGKGKEIIEARDGNMQIITTLYGPPPFMSRSRTLRGRDLNPEYRSALGDYMVDWVRYLRENENLPVKYLSLHNEGEDWGRMPVDGRKENETHQHLDYNMYWPPHQVVDYLKLLPEKLKAQGLEEVKLAPGEGTNWYRFNSMGYAKAISDDPTALANLGLITSHGFYNGRFWRLFSGTTNHGTWMLQDQRPELHAWTTSMSWMASTIDFANLIYYHVYLARVNGLIPWAFIQRPKLWDKGDPNPGNAFTVFEDSTYRTTRGYYFYKQFTQVGRPGMSVAYTQSLDPSVYFLGFGANGTNNPDAFVVVNNGYSFAGQADALEIVLSLDGIEKHFFFSHKEPVATSGKNKVEDMKGVEFDTRTTQDGYILEASFPWETIGKKPEDIKDMHADLQIQSGAEDLENRVGWQAGAELGQLMGRLIPGNNSTKDGLVIASTDKPITVDGVTEAVWSDANTTNVNHPRLEKAQFELSGKVKWIYDDKNLYLLAEIRDETNLKHKRFEVALEGTNYKKFKAFRTSYHGERYEAAGTYELKNGNITFDSPGYSVTTFIGVR